MKMKQLLPGIALAFAIGIPSMYFGVKIPLIGPVVFGLILGLFLNVCIRKKDVLKPGLTFTSKKLLKLAIILLGGSFVFSQIFTVGKYSLYVMCFTLFAAYLSGLLLSKLFHIKWELGALISTGTGVCGGSAIAALSPIIEADDSDIAYAIAATFLFDIFMIFLFPWMGHILNLSDLAYGLWTGTAVNDTSSVVAAGYAYSDAAGDFATIVKLTRTLSILPITLAFALFITLRKAKVQKAEGSATSSINLRYFAHIFPWFILIFLGFAGINSYGLFPETWTVWMKQLSRLLMAMALGAIGFQTDFKKIASAGIAPMFLGFTVSVFVVIVALSAQFTLGQI